MSLNILGAVGEHLRAKQNQPSSLYQSAPAHNLTANTSGLSGTNGNFGSASMNVGSYWPSQYQYYFTGILPAEPYLNDPASLNYFWRDIYLYDSVGGSVVDLMLNIPFSDFTLHGIDAERKQVYEDAISQLNMRDMFSTIGWAYYVDGFFCGTAIYDAHQRRFVDTMVHDALSCSVKTSPLFNRDPSITVTTANSMAQFLAGSPANAEYVRNLPRAFQELLSEGRFELNPASTLFVPRKTMTDRSYVSYLHRLLPIYLIEKALFRGTLTESQRRQRATTHITADDTYGTPNAAELSSLVQTFMAAEADPIGGWIATRSGVQASDVRPAADFFKWQDAMDQLSTYKLRALGVSESFLGSDGVTFQSHEASYSMFLEGLNESREKLTHRVFYQRLFPMIAIINGFFKDGSKNTRKEFVDFFYNATDRANLIMPRIQWKKELKGEDEYDSFEMLEKAAEHGVPVPLRRWMAAAKIDPDALMREIEEDTVLRQVLEETTGKDTSHEADDENYDYDMSASNGYGRPTTIPMSMYNQHVPKVPLLSRFSGTQAEEYTYTRTGKKKAIPSMLQAEHRIKHNQQISKIDARVRKDPNYRLSLMKQNNSKFGKYKHSLG